MSRFGAGLGALVGSLGGVVAGSLVVGQMVDFTPDEPSDEVFYRKEREINAGMLFGGAVGSVIGAAVGAGNSEPKQVGTAGVGALPKVTGAVFP